MLQNNEYKTWLTELKRKFLKTQQRAAVKVNSTLLEFYWNLGAEIVEKQKNSSWGDDLLSQLSLDLMKEFTGVKGVSKRNLELIQQWYLF